jgi:S-adenosyl methyltransferase
VSDDNWMRQPFTPSVLPVDYFRRPSPARMWNYLQGGDDNFALDRSAGDAYAEGYPEIFYLARQSRRFLMRAVRVIAEEGGVHQFLDLGCGLPAPSGLRNVHDIAQEIHPRARVVYVDNDKVVISHADALLKSRTPEGATAYIEADVHDPEPILAQAADTLDFSQPVGILMVGVLGHVAEYDEARSIVDRLLAAVPTGSYLVVSDGTDVDENKVKGVVQRNSSGVAAYYSRSLAQFGDYFAGLELLDPGCVPVSQWRPEPAEIGAVRAVASYAGVALKTAR